METTVLIIDDDMAIRESLAAYLEDRDYRVVLANDGKSGLKALEAERPDLALVDLSMPGVDGFEVLKRAGETMPDTPLIVVSGTGRISDTVRALHLGAWDYILKPIEDMSVVEHALGKALDRARLRRDNLRYQNQLEELVQARTAELEESNIRMRDLNARLRRLVEATSGLSSCFEIKQFGRRLLEEFAGNMAASGGSIYSVERNGLHLLHTLDPGHAAEIIPFPLPDRSILRRLLDQTAPLLINDIREYRDLAPSGWTGYRNGSTLAFPLLDETGKVSILLTLHNKYAPPFVEQDK
ncbi:MAG TPA: response regulator, partial [bacterium]|nr:response regulator [bacterium]